MIQIQYIIVAVLYFNKQEEVLNYVSLRNLVRSGADCRVEIAYQNKPNFWVLTQKFFYVPAKITWYLNNFRFLTNFWKLKNKFKKNF